MADGSRFDDRSGMGFTITLPLLVRQRARHDDRIAFMHASQHIARQRTERLDRNPYGRAIPPFLCGIVEIAASTPILNEQAGTSLPKLTGSEPAYPLMVIRPCCTIAFPLMIANP